ncbi:hypothetical protein [Lentisalinibacter salinarum]|uniref:hypothetical protein n=1 Tax=Lentisalinibacter salinarum TaxID=2992239 RepID=UPI0038686B7B
MDATLRIRALSDIKERESHGAMEVFYKGEKKTMPVYEIPLDVLIYNQYNGRISSLVKSYEMQHGHIDPTTMEGRSRIERFLWISNETRNKKTLRDLEKHGQLKYGIVTRDGIIIDGNRRASLLSRLAKKRNQEPGYFKAVILDDTLDQDPREIQRLETIYQMGEDEKLTYNPIEKYLRCKDLEAAGFNTDEIAEMMSESHSRVETWLEIMRLMDEFLDELGYSQIYTRLDETEGPFVDLQRYLARYAGSQSTMVDWQYSEQDLNDLKLIMFDYIRARFTGSGGKDYRYIAQPSKKESFFCRRDIWEQFRDNHFEKTESASEDLPSINDYRQQNPGLDLEDVLQSRDDDWTNRVTDSLKENLGKSRGRLENLNERDAPVKLLARVLSILKDVDTESPTFLEDEAVRDAVYEINRITYDFKKLLKG